MAAPQSKEQKLELIRENLSEVLNPEIIDEVLNKDETLRIYWGVWNLHLCCLETEIERMVTHG